MSELTEQNLTRQQAEQEMACLRKIYASVRLLDPKMLAEEPCYPPWKNVHPCTSCVGREAMAGKCQCSKLETLGSSLYQVTARYVEVDGKPYVMEMILPLDASARSSLHSNELIYRDALTGAYNRRFYEEELKHKYLNAGVAMIDLDDFKLCNDTYGHSAGDAALRLITSIIHRCIRSTQAQGHQQASLRVPSARVREDARLGQHRRRDGRRHPHQRRPAHRRQADVPCKAPQEHCRHRGHRPRCRLL